MWYVIQTICGQEAVVQTYLEKEVPKEILEKSFIPRREWEKRLGGKWVRVTEGLFPGYLFVITEQPEELFFRLKKIPRMTRLLADETYYFVSLRQEEIALIQRMGIDCGDYTLHVSEVELNEKGEIGDINGRLQGFRDNIVRVNKRKRYAAVEVTMFQKKIEIYFGIVIGGYP